MVYIQFTYKISITLYNPVPLMGPTMGIDTPKSWDITPSKMSPSVHNWNCTSKIFQVGRIS
jgi:hypothetical protein